MNKERYKVSVIKIEDTSFLVYENFNKKKNLDKRVEELIKAEVKSKNGTISCGVLGSIESMSSESQMMTSLNKHSGRWKTVASKVESATGKKYSGGISTYNNYINRWTGAHLGTHNIIRNGIYVHGPHFHPWIV